MIPKLTEQIPALDVKQSFPELHPPLHPPSLPPEARGLVPLVEKIKTASCSENSFATEIAAYRDEIKGLLEAVQNRKIILPVPLCEVVKPLLSTADAIADNPEGNSGPSSWRLLMRLAEPFGHDTLRAIEKATEAVEQKSAEESKPIEPEPAVAADPLKDDPMGRAMILIKNNPNLSNPDISSVLTNGSPMFSDRLGPRRIFRFFE